MRRAWSPGIVAALFLLAAAPWRAAACGWGGDSEGEDIDAVEVVTAASESQEEAARQAQVARNRFQTQMGDRYRLGAGLKQDYREAIRWYTRAALERYAAAQNNLGNMYEKGLGVDRSDIVAARWFRMAAVQGNEKAQHSLGEMYSQGRGVVQDAKQAAEWTHKAATGGHSSARREIAGMLWEGKGVAKDAFAAYGWWKLGVVHGDEASAKSLAMARTKMPAKDVAAAEEAFATAHIPASKRTSSGLYLTAAAALAQWRADTAKVKLLDTRTVEEYIFAGHAPGACIVPLETVRAPWDPKTTGPKMQFNDQFVSQVREKLDEDDVILIMCHSGVRSATAANILSRAGFKTVYNIVDGFIGDAVEHPNRPGEAGKSTNGWKTAGGPWTYHLDPKLMP